MVGASRALGFSFHSPLQEPTVEEPARLVVICKKTNLSEADLLPLRRANYILGITCQPLGWRNEEDDETGGIGPLASYGGAGAPQEVSVGWKDVVQGGKGGDKEVFRTATMTTQSQ